MKKYTSFVLGALKNLIWKIRILCREYGWSSVHWWNNIFCKYGTIKHCWRAFNPFLANFQSWKAHSCEYLFISIPGHWFFFFSYICTSTDLVRFIKQSMSSRSKHFCFFYAMNCKKLFLISGISYILDPVI